MQCVGKLDDAAVQQACCLYVPGMTCRDIAEKLGVSKRQIENLKLKKHDVDYDRALELRARWDVDQGHRQAAPGWMATC